MNVKLRVILLTVSISLLVWAICSVLALTLFRQTGFVTNITSSQVILVVSTFIIVLTASVTVGIILSRVMAERRKALEELKESDERMRALAGAAVEGVIIHDGDIFLEANDIGARLLGLEPSEIRGKSFADFIAPESRELVLQHFRESFTEPYEVMLRRQNGTTFPVEICGRDAAYKSKKVRVLSIRDITQRRKADEELRFRGDLLDACSDSIILHDYDGVIVYINEAACKSHGYTRDELMRISYRNLTVSESGPVMRPEVEEVEKKGDVIFESAHYRKDGSILPLEVHARTFKWGNREFVLSVGRDITERKKTEEELRFRSELLDACSDSLLWADAEGNFVYVNEAACRAHGYTHDEMMKVNINKLIVPEYSQLASSKTGEVLKTGDVIFECAQYRKNGTILPLEIHAHVFKMGNEDHVLSICRDITERKQSEELLKNISFNSPAGIFIFQNSKFQFVNPRMIETTGYSEAEIMQMDIDKLIYPEDLQNVRREVIKALKGESITSSEYRTVRKDGKVVWNLGSIVLIQYRGRRAILGTAVDITIQKEAEEARRGTEIKYHELVNVITSGVAVYQGINNGEDFVFIDFNDAAEKIEKISREQVIGRKVTEVFPGVKDFGLFKVFQRVWRTGKFEYFPDTMYKDERDPGTWRENWVYKLPNGEIVSVYNDITERKIAEQALKESEEKYRLIVENSQDIIFTLNNGIFIYVSPSVKTMLGYNQSDLIGVSFMTLVHPDDRYIIEDAIRNDDEDAHKTPGGHQYRFRHASGEWRWHVSSGTKMVSAEGQPSDFIGVANDITERKKAEEALKVSEQNFRNSIDSSLIGVRIVDTEWRTLYANQRYLDIFGFKNVGEIGIVGPKELYSREEYDRYLKRQEVRQQGEKVSEELEIEIVRKDGTTRYIQTSLNDVLWNGQRQQEMLCNDITERKLAENALKTSEERFRRLAENIPDVITRFKFVPTRGYEYVSPASTVVTGYTPEEYYANPGLGNEMIYPEDKGLQHTMATRPEYYKGIPLVTRYVRKDGRIIWVERRQMPIYDENAQLVALEGIDRDVTEDIRMEEALRMSETNFRNSMDNSPLGIRVESIDRETIYTNHKFLDIYGYENLGEFRSKSAQERLTPESYREYLTFIEKEEHGEVNPDTYEISIIRKDGTIRHLEAFRKKVLWGGEPQFQVLYNDVTERKKAEEALRASEENFRNSLDNSLVGIRISDIDNNTLYANQALLDIFGYRNLDEVKAISPQTLYSPESYADYLKMREVFGRGEPMPDQVDIDIIRRDGAIRHIQALFKILNWDGKLQYQTIYNDITERQQAEQALKESEQKYRQLVETAQEGIMLTDSGGRITFVNSRMVEMQGYTAAEMIGKHVYDFQDENSRKILNRELNQRHFGIRGEYDTEFDHKNGTRIQARVGATPLFDDKGNYTGSMAVIVDISALKQAEERILHLNSVLNALRGISQLITLEEDRGSLLQKSCDLLVHTRGYDTAWVVLTDEKGNFVSGVSCGIESQVFTPLLKDFVKGQYLPCTNDLLRQKEDTILCPQLGSKHEDCPLGELGDKLGNLSGRLEYEGRLYGILSVQLPSKLAVDKEEQELFKELTGDIAFALDGLEKETQLEEAEAKAREIEKMREVDHLRSELLANVSHELRTPLASIKGYASTLLRTDVKWSATQRQDFLQTIDDETDRLTKLINDILDMSRIEGGALKLRQERTRVPEIFNSIMSRLKALTEHHHLTVNIPAKLPAVFADEMRIGQVISNLVDNAIKFSPAGSEINISARRDKEKVIISVTDHGVGMSKEVVSKLFNRFYQAENVVTGRRHGTGLGLAICRGIIESHGGEIWAESEVGVGSKFSFSIPVWKETDNV